MTWYCIRTMRRAELSLVEELRALGLTAYVPVEIHDRKIRGRLVRVCVPAFQGYAFVECDLTDKTHEQILACEGAFDFVRCHGSGEAREPARMPGRALQSVFLDELFGDLDFTRVPEAYKPARGDRVAVKRGMWKGRIARIISVGKRDTLLEAVDGVGRWKVATDALELAA